MNIYFTASARASGEEKENHELIYKTIDSLGHRHIDDFHIDSNQQKFYSAKNQYYEDVHKQALNFVQNSDIVILEVSTHSLTMGYLIKHAIDTHTQVIALHTKNHSPGFILGIDVESFQLIEYNKETLRLNLEKAIEYVKDLEDIRFNLMLPPKVSAYLNEAAEKQNVSKAHFIRDLIMQHKKRVES